MCWLADPATPTAYVRRLREHESDRVCILDWVSGDALDELLTNAMLLVLPSDLEGLSLALLDAMGAGVCVLASDVPENRELLEVPALLSGMATDDLERMLRLLISEPEVRKAAASKARDRVWSHVSVETGLRAKLKAIFGTG